MGHVFGGVTEHTMNNQEVARMNYDKFSLKKKNELRQILLRKVYTRQD